MKKKFLLDLNNQSGADREYEDKANFLIQKQKLERIDNFNGYYDFLNNEYQCLVYYQGLVYKSVSYAFQAARSTQDHVREKISKATSNQELYELALGIEDPPDWNKTRLKVMEILVRDKFRRNKDLREKLIATENRELINTFSDLTSSNIFWGIVDGNGQNQLGRILEQVREDCQKQIELQAWMYSSFSLQEDFQLIPIIKLKAFKSGKQIEEIILEKKPYYLMGQHKTNAVIMLHQSISRFQAVIINDQMLGQCIIDLGSKSGSFMNERKLEPHIPYRLIDEEIKLRFAVSTRIYKVSIDNSEVERNIEIKKRQLEKNLLILDKLNNPEVNNEILLASLGLVNDDTLFISNLPDNISTRKLEERFSVYGKIKDISLPIDRKTGKSQKFCFIAYYDEAHAKKALIANRTYIDKSQIKVRLAEKKNTEDILEEKLDRIDKEQLRKKYENTSKEIYEQKYGKKIQTLNLVEKNENNNKNNDNEEEEKQKHKEKRKSRSRSKSRAQKKRKHRSKSKSQQKDKDRKKDRNREDKVKEKSKKHKKSSKSREKDQDKKKEKDKQTKETDKDKNQDKEKKKDKDKSKKHKKKSRSRSKSSKDKKASKKDKKEKKNSEEHKKHKNENNEKKKENKHSEKKQKKENKKNDVINDEDKEEQIMYSSAAPSNSDNSSDLDI